MRGVHDQVTRVMRLDSERKRMVAALLLIRYCGWYRDPKFQMWFAHARDALAHVTSAARGVLGGEELDLAELRGELDEALEACDPDGPPFEAEVTDHLVFGTEVLDFLGALDDSDALSQVFERADELAEARQEVASEELPEGHELASVDFVGCEAGIREEESADVLDRRGVLERSEEFSDLYARVIGLSYTNEDAGIADVCSD